MTMAVRKTRGANELAAQRAAADAETHSPYLYEREKARAVRAALDWIEGWTDRAPVSGDPVSADERAVVGERLHAGDIEDRALRSGLDGTFPGMVALVLSWYHCRQFCEAPY